MFRLHSPYVITEAQQQAVDSIADRFRQDRQCRQVLLGVTGSGKTFTMAHIIKELAVPALVLAPNKTLAAQLYQEFKGFFPHDRVGYFISYYDYYMPEAYVPQRNLYIAKEVSINPELERLRIESVRSVLESRQTIIVASVSSIYNIGSPDDFSSQKMVYRLRQQKKRDQVIHDFIALGYSRSEELLEAGRFRVRGNRIEVFPTSEENPVRLVFDGETLIAISRFDAITSAVTQELKQVSVFPSSYFFYDQKRISATVAAVKSELQDRIGYFLARQQAEYAERLKQRTLYDMEMLEQFGYCSGIENYSLYLSGRRHGDAPYTLLDFFPGDFLTIVDESHITVPQLGGMFEGDRSRKQKLVEYGFRLPSALENRPLNFREISERFARVLYVSATPAGFEIRDSQNRVTELLVRPTGLLDPEIIVKKAVDPVHDMLAEIRRVIPKNRVLVTTLTKKMSEKLADYLSQKGLRCSYLHSEIKALDRIKIIKKLRSGEIDVLIGINLLREGLDLPEVARVIILDADREGFLRSTTSLIQTFGRAARNLNGKVILYVENMTESLKRAIEESQRRRQVQTAYNLSHQIRPQSIRSPIKDFYDDDYWIRQSESEWKQNFKSRQALDREIRKLTSLMKKKAANLDFKSAAQLRDRITALKNLSLEMF